VTKLGDCCEAHAPLRVPGEGLVSRTQAVGRTQLNGRPVSSMNDDDLKRFTPVAGIEIPVGPPPARR
jgi:hypothetical protein